MADFPSLRLQPKQQITQKQHQMLMMLPEMQQSIAFLQAPLVEMTQLILQELEKNPLLELVEEIGTEIEEKREEEVEEVKIDLDDFEIMLKLDEEYRDFFEQDFSVPAKKNEEKLRLFLDNSIISPVTLFAHLMEQAHETFTNEEDLRLAEVLIGSLDARGFLLSSDREIATLAKVDPVRIGHVLKEVQSFDPIGVGARSLQETLLIQLAAKGKEEGIAYVIVRDYFDDLLHNRISHIQRGMNKKIETIQQAIDHEIAHLDFHPGNYYVSQAVNYIIPDAMVLEEDTSLIVEVNEETLPRLRVNKKYLRMLQKDDITDEVRDFVHQHLLSAKWMLRSISQRGDTLHRILDYLIKTQRDFIVNPQGLLKPMSMLEVAKELELHESTIARAVSNKYVSLPRGVTSLRSFFCPVYVKTDGTAISQHTVRNAILKVIQEEDREHPYSDQEIAEKLTEKGITCARRTVAKHRGILKLGNAFQRRKYK